MNWIQRLILYGLSSPVGRAWAQGPSTPAPLPSLPRDAGLEVVDASTGFVLVSTGILLLLIVGMGVKLYDLARKRRQDAAAVQTKISDAIVADPMLSRLPLTPTVRMPLWRGKPLIVEVVGSVPSPGLRQAAADLVLREALRFRKGCQLETRISVEPGMLRRVA